MFLSFPPAPPRLSFEIIRTHIHPHTIFSSLCFSYDLARFVYTIFVGEAVIANIQNTDKTGSTWVKILKDAVNTIPFLEECKLFAKFTTVRSKQSAHSRLVNKKHIIDITQIYRIHTNKRF